MHHPNDELDAFFALPLTEGKVAEEVVANMRSWRHSGFSVDQSVRLEAGDQQGVRRLLEHFLRCPFSQARMIEVMEAGKVNVIEKILRHCGLWDEGSARAPRSAKVSVTG